MNEDYYTVTESDMLFLQNVQTAYINLLQGDLDETLRKAQALREEMSKAQAVKFRKVDSRVSAVIDEATGCG